MEDTKAPPLEHTQAFIELEQRVADRVLAQLRDELTETIRQATDTVLNQVAEAMGKAVNATVVKRVEFIEHMLKLDDDEPAPRRQRDDVQQPAALETLHPAVQRFVAAIRRCNQADLDALPHEDQAFIRAVDGRVRDHRRGDGALPSVEHVFKALEMLPNKQKPSGFARFSDMGQRKR